LERLPTENQPEIPGQYIAIFSKAFHVKESDGVPTANFEITRVQYQLLYDGIVLL